MKLNDLQFGAPMFTTEEARSHHSITVGKDVHETLNILAGRRGCSVAAYTQDILFGLTCGGRTQSQQFEGRRFGVEAVFETLNSLHDFEVVDLINGYLSSATYTMLEPAAVLALGIIGRPGNLNEARLCVESHARADLVSVGWSAGMANARVSSVPTNRRNSIELP